jgi:hypothetical protein
MPEQAPDEQGVCGYLFLPSWHPTDVSDDVIEGESHQESSPFE